MHQDIRKTLSWMVCAMFVVSLAIWQAQVAVTQGQRTHEVALPQPVKTRHAERSSPQPAAGDPFTNYQSRKEKGLTNLEIGWIVDDFKTAGLDLGIRAATREEYLAERQAQDRWYRDALVEGWGLNDEQAAQVTLKLSELYDLAKADFIEALNAGSRPFKSNGQWYDITGTEPIYQLLAFNRRIVGADSTSLPWCLWQLPKGDYKDVYDLSHNLLPQTETSVPAEIIEPKSLSEIRTLHPAHLKLLLLISPNLTRDLEKLLEAPSP